MSVNKNNSFVPLERKHHPKPERRVGCPRVVGIMDSSCHLLSVLLRQQFGSESLPSTPLSPWLTGTGTAMSAGSFAPSTSCTQGHSGARVGQEMTRTCRPSLGSQESHKVPGVIFNNTRWRHKRTETGKTTLPILLQCCLDYYRIQIMKPFHGECGSM